MRGLRWLGPALIVFGIAALIAAFLQGEATLNLFVIFPVVTATGGWAALGILLMIAGFLASFLTLPAWMGEPKPAVSEGESERAPRGEEPSAPPQPPRRFGGVVFLGPVPIVFGSDAAFAKWMFLAGAVLFVALLVLTIIALRGI